MEPKSTIWEPHRSLLQWQGETFSICYLGVNSDCTCRWRSTNGQRETLLWRSRSKDTPARWNPEVSPKLFSNKPAVHLVTILSPCNIFRCLICTGTQESRPCWPPPRSTATSTSGISGGPANHQIVKQEGINYQQGSTEADPVLPDDSGSLPHKVEPRGLHLPCKVLDVR